MSPILKIMFSMPEYKDNIELIVDEICTMVTGGVGSFGCGLQNELYYLAKD
jgi:hypothetical protein